MSADRASVLVPSKAFREFAGKSVLLTGANGFIGGYLAEALQEVNASILGLGRSGWAFPPGMKYYTGDLRDAAFVRNCVEESCPDYVFHLAAFKERTSTLESFAEATQINLLGTLNLLTALNRVGKTTGIVAMGTAEEYGPNLVPFMEGGREIPVNAYSFSKVCVTHLCEILYQLHALPVCVIRPTLAYGPRQARDMFLPALITALAHNQPFPMSPGQQTRDYIFVTDVVDALLRSALTPSVFGQVLNVGSGETVKIADLALRVEQNLNRNDLVKIGAFGYRKGEIMQYSVCTSKAAELLGWSPRVLLTEGLGKTIDYYRRAAEAGH